MVDDFRITGFARPLDGGNSGSAAFDVGAYEFVHPTADTDGDQQTDAHELIAGTSRADGSDCFGIRSVWRTPAGGCAMSWQGVSGRLYSVRRKANMIESLWSSVPDYTNVAGTGSPLTFSNAAPAGLPEFHRLTVRRRN